MAKEKKEITDKQKAARVGNVSKARESQVGKKRASRTPPGYISFTIRSSSQIRDAMAATAAERELPGAAGQAWTEAAILYLKKHTKETFIHGFKAKY